jgi:hypothetical protein
MGGRRPSQPGTPRRVTKVSRRGCAVETRGPVTRRCWRTRHAAPASGAHDPLGWGRRQPGAVRTGAGDRAVLPSMETSPDDTRPESPAPRPTRSQSRRDSRRGGPSGVCHHDTKKPRRSTLSDGALLVPMAPDWGAALHSTRGLVRDRLWRPREHRGFASWGVANVSRKHHTVRSIGDGDLYCPVAIQLIPATGDLCPGLTKENVCLTTWSLPPKCDPPWHERRRRPGR